MKTKLADEIRDAINRVSRENNSNTPDYILANYLMGCLDAFEAAVNQRDKWYDVTLSPLGKHFGPAKD